jgi:DNA-directed RNA polymerase beta' subunit
LKPETGGLFANDFGPVNDFQCACGKHKTQENLKVCPTCGVAFHHEVDAIKWVGLN